MPINKIGRMSVSDAVLEEIKQLISSGEWPEGSKIPSENELAARMEVSRVSIRSALQKLSSVGLIESRQGEGTFVCKINGGLYMNMLTPTAILVSSNQKYMVEFRRVIESEQAYLAAQRMTDRELFALKENYEMMKREDPASSECSEVDVEFHLLIAKACKNPMFIQTSNILRDMILDNILYMRKYTKENQALFYHKQLLDAFESRDAEKARNIMYEHLEQLWQLVQD